MRCASWAKGRPLRENLEKVFLSLDANLPPDSGSRRFLWRTVSQAASRTIGRPVRRGGRQENRRGDRKMLAGLLWLALIGAGKGGAHPAQLRCEYRVDPLGIDVA